MAESALTRQGALNEVPVATVASSPAPALDELSWTPAAGGLSGFGPALRRAVAQDAPSSTMASGAGEEASLSTPGSGVLVGPADDPAERAADQLADRALRRLTDQLLPSETEAVPPVLRRSTTPTSTSSGGTSAETIGAAGGELDARTAAAIRRSRSGGSPLPAAVRGRMETAFGQDLSAIRVHADGQAAELNTAVSARAFTTGRDIFFGAGEYHPSDAEGEHVLAHEIAHAVTEPAGVSRYLRRTISVTSRDIQQSRSLGSALKGLVTGKGALLQKDTLYRLGIVLDGYQRERAPQRKKDTLTVILGLCERYLRDQGQIIDDEQPDTKAQTDDTDQSDDSDQSDDTAVTKKSPKKKPPNVLGKKTRGTAGHKKKKQIDLVERIKAEAIRERSQIAAQERYLDDAYGRGGTNTPLKAQRSKGLTHHVAKALGAGKTVSDVEGGGDAALELAREYGLTEAEILAIRTTTVDDYRYIHPTTAQDDKWLDVQIGHMGGPQAVPDKKVLQEEGTLQSGVAMMGLAKLPPVRLELYRGIRLTEADYDKTIGAGIYRIPAITSTSLDKVQARGYCRGGTKEQKVAIFLILHVTNGRDIAKLSNFGGEQEVVLLPGAEFVAIKPPRNDPTLAKGAEGVEFRKVVEMTQVK